MWRGFERAGSGKAGRSQDDGVALALTKLANAGFDVAAERDEVEVGALALKLYDTASRGCPHFGAAFEGLQVDPVHGDEHVAGILANGNTHDAHALGEWHVPGNVLERMHRKVSIAAYDDRLDLADKQPLAPYLRKRPVLDPIALGSYVHLFDGEVGEMGT